MSSEALLLAGVGTAAVFMAVLVVEGARRPGYDPVYHTGSELELGERGWVQRTSFMLMAAGAFAFAVGVHDTVDTVVGAVLLGIFAFGLLVAGAFAPDPVRGFPPGAPAERPEGPSWRHRTHHLIGGPVAFLALFGACVTLAVRLDGAWRLYTALTAAAGLAFTVWTALSYQRDARRTGLVQRGLILVYWSWIVALGIHLVADPPEA